jgi:hypothetical protein
MAPYMNVHRQLAAHLPAGKDQTAEQLAGTQQALAQNIRAIRTRSLVPPKVRSTNLFG